jgi:hypothetical protein
LAGHNRNSAFEAGRPRGRKKLLRRRADFQRRIRYGRLEGRRTSIGNTELV